VCGVVWWGLALGLASPAPLVPGGGLGPCAAAGWRVGSGRQRLCRSWGPPHLGGRVAAAVELRPDRGPARLDLDAAVALACVRVQGVAPLEGAVLVELLQRHGGGAQQHVRAGRLRPHLRQQRGPEMWAGAGAGGSWLPAGGAGRQLADGRERRAAAAGGGVRRGSQRVCQFAVLDYL
jgi:hypothetical protein